MIHLQVVSVSHQNSSRVNTTLLTYQEGKDEPEKKVEPGAEWEEIILQVQAEDKPSIQVANIRGNAFLAGGIMEPDGSMSPNCIKLIVNKREWFGTFKTGDIIPLVTVREDIK